MNVALRLAARLLALLLAAACATPRIWETGHAILIPSDRTSPWPVDGETRPGIWFRFDPIGTPVDAADMLDSIRIVVSHSGRTQAITGAEFSPLEGGGATRQTRYYYTPRDGALFLTLELQSPGRSFYPDTQRIELNDDCWQMVSYRVRGPSPAGRPVPPPYPRTVLLTPPGSPETPLFLEVMVSGNCFRNPLPPS